MDISKNWFALFSIRKARNISAAVVAMSIGISSDRYTRLEKNELKRIRPEEKSMICQFFNLPEENDAYCAFVQGIVPNGGGDIPENAFEAIATAMKSDWTPAETGKKRRQVIVVFTDAPALPLGERAGSPNYPTDIPTTMADFSAWWEGVSQEYGGSYNAVAGRLIAFAPNDESWTQLESWSRFIPSYTACRGCSDIDMQMILDIIVGSFDK